MIALFTISDLMSSYASDIAEKYGVTYEMLTGNKK